MPTNLLICPNCSGACYETDDFCPECGSAIVFPTIPIKEALGMAVGVAAGVSVYCLLMTVFFVQQSVIVY